MLYNVHVNLTLYIRPEVVQVNCTVQLTRIIDTLLLRVQVVTYKVTPLNIKNVLLVENDSKCRFQLHVVF